MPAPLLAAQSTRSHSARLGSAHTCRRPLEIRHLRALYAPCTLTHVLNVKQTAGWRRQYVASGLPESVDRL